MTADPVAELRWRLEQLELRCRAQEDAIAALRRTVAEQRFRGLGYRLRWLVAPRIGTLAHHPPRPLRSPAPFVGRLPPERLPSLGIVTPSLRQGVFIERTLQSVLDQGYPNLTYVVQDGGSEDGTVAILESHASRLTRWVSEPDAGQTQAINRGLSCIDADVMAWINSDDLSLPGSLRYVAEYFATHPEVDVVYGHRILIDENDDEIGRWVLPPHSAEALSWADFVPQETLFWRRRAWERIGARLDESFHFAADWDLLLRLRDSGCKMVRLPRFLGAFRIHPHQKTSSALHDVGVAEMARLRERCHGRPVTQAEIRRALIPYVLRHLAWDRASRLRLKLGGSP